MGNLANLRSLAVSLIALLFLTIKPGYSQPVPVDSIIVKDEISSFSKDRTGNIFIAFKGGAIAKYNNNLDSLISFSPTKLGDITLLEAGHGFQIFAFYEDFQEYAILDRFLTRDSRYSISETSSNYIDICTYSRDQNLWAFEENQIRLVKINLSIRQIDIDVPLEFIIDARDHQISFIKEYQNLIFIIDETSGIYIFDNLGNYLRKVEAVGVKQLSFSRERLHFISHDELHSIGLYEESNEVLKLSHSNYLGVLSTEKYNLLIMPHKIVRIEQNQ